MNKVQTLLFSLILLLSPIAGCLEDNAEEDDTTPEDEPSPINQDVNETDDNTGGGTDNTGNGDDDGEDTSPNTPVNETDDNTGGTDSNGNTGNSGDNTDNSNQNETNDNSEEEEEETNPGKFPVEKTMILVMEIISLLEIRQNVILVKLDLPSA